MFSFHKPRVYRSTEGCCICRAKSSSSRFTDSRKYEPESVKCFDLTAPRQGEICNACVLLVKRFKRLPVGSKKTWGHVVDARAGPGTKSLTKHKKRKDDNNDQPSNNSNSGTKSSLLTEKFTKIFKKSSKNGKTTKQNANTTTADPTWLYYNQSLPTTPDSFDSDIEDNNNKQLFNMPPPLSSGVQFQTQTRASANRTRHNHSNTTVTSADALRIKYAKNSIQLRAGIIGSKRRKCLIPRKKCHLIDNVKFFDESEWQERKSCCGQFYELAGAIIIDIAHYNPCAEHRRKFIPATKEGQQQHKETNILAAPPSKRTIGETSAAEVQLLSPGLVPAHQPTPVLKKHHLFYRRQSECFPHGDNFKSNTTNTFIKTELLSSHTINAVNNNKTITRTPTAIRTQANVASNISAFPTVDNNTYSLLDPPTFGTPQMAGKSLANLPNISPPRKPTPAPPAPPPPKSTNASISNSYTNFLHKIKADTASKIVKHSIEKFSTAQLRELKEAKHANKPTEKTFVLAQPQQNTTNAVQHQHHQLAHSHSHPLTTNPTGVSPIYNSSASTKFSDNSSDSGFDENTLDRKSASPLQEDTEKKLQSRHAVQTMFLASGVQIHGQQQNLVLTGNEVAAKMQQVRKLSDSGATVIQQNNIQRNISETAIGASTSSNGAHAKIRAIYTHNNSIQHENGITTIVPASSFAATTQTAAMMNALSTPSTVTITPAPPHGCKTAKVFISSNNQSNLVGLQQKSNLIKTTKTAGGDANYNNGNN